MTLSVKFARNLTIGVLGGAAVGATVGLIVGNSMRFADLIKEEIHLIKEDQK